MARRERELLPILHECLRKYYGKTVLITGADGSIGKAVTNIFEYYNVNVISTDIDDMNVMHVPTIESMFDFYDPNYVFHFAAAKHAPAGEEDPAETYKLNIIGTENILEACKWNEAKLILASTCKACNPETAYGASKLIAERMVLNAGHNVVRFYNVVESSGNVFEIWANTPEDQPLLYTTCGRFFISLREAAQLAIIVGALESGRYSLDPGANLNMSRICYELYPNRERQGIPPRRGDRIVEPLMAKQEVLLDAPYPYIKKVVSYHDKA